MARTGSSRSSPGRRDEIIDGTQFWKEYSTVVAASFMPPLYLLVSQNDAAMKWTYFVHALSILSDPPLYPAPRSRPFAHSNPPHSEHCYVPFAPFSLKESRGGRIIRWGRYVSSVCFIDILMILFPVTFWKAKLHSLAGLTSAAHLNDNYIRKRKDTTFHSNQIFRRYLSHMDTFGHFSSKLSMNSGDYT